MSALKPINRLPDLLRDADESAEMLFHRLSNFAFMPAPALQGRMWFPVVELSDMNEELVLTAELPGVRIEDVDIDLQGNVLTLRGSKRQEQDKKEKRYHLWERSYGEFERSFTLPPAVDPAQIRAELDDGVLVVHMPKRAEALSRRIPVSST